MNYLIKVSAILLLGILICSCETEDLNADEGVVAENYLGATDGNCLDKVYPLNYQFPDSTVIEVLSREELKELIQAYKEENPDDRVRVKLVYPIDVVTSKGEVVSVESREAHKELRRAECSSGSESNGSKGRRKKCFEKVYPISLVATDGTVITGESRQELKEALKAWKIENPDADEKPVLQFPIQVINSDEETVELASAEELATLREECQE